MIAAVE